MNAYVEGRFHDFKEYFYSHDKQEQLKLISGYYSSRISNVLSGRAYCELLASYVVENFGLNVGTYTFEQLVDKIEEFLDKKENKLYPTWQRNILAFIERRIRNSCKQSTI